MQDCFEDVFKNLWSVSPRARKIIFVIDSCFAAQSVALIIQRIDLEYSVIFEKKTVVDKNFDIKKATEYLYPNIDTENSIDVEVPSHYFLTSQSGMADSWCKWRKFKSQVLENVKLDPSAIFVGQITSSIIRCCPVSKAVIVEHGYGEIAERCINPEYRIKTATQIRNFLKVLVGIPAGHSDTKNRIGLCKLKESYCSHIDYREIEVSKCVEEITDSLQVKSLKPVLFLASSPPISASGQAELESRLLRNFELVTSHCDTSEMIFIKYHKSVYVSEGWSNIDLGNMLAGHGYKSVVIDEVVPSFLKGQLPAETLVKALGVKKVVCEVSSVSLNISHDETVTAIVDLAGSDSYRARDKELFRLIEPELNGRIELYL